MKKSISLMAITILLGTSVFVFAHGEKKEMGDKGMGMMGGGMMKGGMMDKSGMMGMCPMMQSMMQKQVVATSDGGIIVVAGNKITKYDKDLNVVKEVESKMGMEGMQKMMDNMKNMCPMMEKMKSSDESKAEESKESAEEETAEHESHHPENK